MPERDFEIARVVNLLEQLKKANKKRPQSRQAGISSQVNQGSKSKAGTRWKANSSASDRSEERVVVLAADDEGKRDANFFDIKTGVTTSTEEQLMSPTSDSIRDAVGGVSSYLDARVNSQKCFREKDFLGLLNRTNIGVGRFGVAPK